MYRAVAGADSARCQRGAAARPLQLPAGARMGGPEGVIAQEINRLTLQPGAGEGPEALYAQFSHAVSSGTDFQWRHA